MNKHYRMVPSLYLKLGPDKYHEVRLGPLTVPQMFSLLEHVPSYWYSMRYQKENEFSKELEDLFTDALDSYNELATEKYLQVDSMDTFSWLGLGIKASAEGVDVWCSFMENGSIVDLTINEDFLSNQARHKARLAHDILAGLFKSDFEEK
jgi:hypothetical protein